MDTTSHPPAPSLCPRCGSDLAAAGASVDGLCARCLGGLSLLTETSPTGGPGAPAAAPLLTPAELAPHFPQLEIIECLGRGGMGVVYKARQKSLDRLVALKLLAPERAGAPGFAERFAREARALASLTHPNIVAVHDFGQAGGFYFLIMEYVDGVNLRQLLRTKRLTPREALSIVPPVCEALQCAHDRGIVHRDIKPENLLIDKAGTVKIADFGIAKILGEDTPGSAAEPTSGTPEYMAPEQSAHGPADHRADIYSLGVVLYEMLTGERPGATLQPPSRRVQVDIRIDEIVLRALEKTPELRFATAAEFRTQVQALTTDPPAASPIPRFTAAALAVVWWYAAFVPLCWGVDQLRHADRPFLTAVLLLAAIPLFIWLAQRKLRAWQGSLDPALVGRRLGGFSSLGWLLSVPAVGFTAFFAFAMASEIGSWHPSLVEAITGPVVALGAILLPFAAARLGRTAPRIRTSCTLLALAGIGVLVLLFVVGAFTWFHHARTAVRPGSGINAVAAPVKVIGRTLIVKTAIYDSRPLSFMYPGNKTLPWRMQMVMLGTKPPAGEFASGQPLLPAEVTATGFNGFCVVPRGSFADQPETMIHDSGLRQLAFVLPSEKLAREAMAEMKSQGRTGTQPWPGEVAISLPLSESTPPHSALPLFNVSEGYGTRCTAFLRFTLKLDDTDPDWTDIQPGERQTTSTGDIAQQWKIRANRPARVILSRGDVEATATLVPSAREPGRHEATVSIRISQTSPGEVWLEYSAGDQPNRVLLGGSLSSIVAGMGNTKFQEPPVLIRNQSIRLAGIGGQPLILTLTDKAR